LRYAISGLLPHGRIDEAAAEVKDALQSDPLSLLVRWWVGTMAYLGCRPERVIEEGRHMVALDPTHFLGHLVAGLGSIESGAAAEAVTALEKARELSGGIPITLGYLAFAYGRAGRPDDARKLLDQMETMATKTYVPPSTLALGHVGLDDWDAAFQWWNQAVDVRDPLIVPIKTFPFFDPVRGDPRYRAILRRMNLSED
jgi:adenylate cyclase